MLTFSDFNLPHIWQNFTSWHTLCGYKFLCARRFPDFAYVKASTDFWQCQLCCVNINTCRSHWKVKQQKLSELLALLVATFHTAKDEQYTQKTKKNVKTLLHRMPLTKTKIRGITIGNKYSKFIRYWSALPMNAKTKVGLRVVRGENTLFKSRGLQDLFYHMTTLKVWLNHVFHAFRCNVASIIPGIILLQ